MVQPAIRGARLRLAVGITAALAASGLASARTAVADAERVALIWNAPAGCPATQAIHDEVDRTLAGSRKEVATVAAAVNVLAPSAPPSNGRWRASVVVHSNGKRAERQFEAESCQALASASALIIALAAEVAGDGAPPTRSTGAVEPPARRADNAIAASPAPGPGQAASGWTSSGQHLVVGGIVDSGTMPDSPALGVEGTAGANWSSSIWRLRLDTGASFFPTQDLPNQNLAGTPWGRYWLISFFGRGCLTAVLARFEFGPCLGGELALMHASIGGPSAYDTQYWVSPLFSAASALRVTSRIVVFGRADFVVPTTRRSFHASTGGGIWYDVYKVPAFAVRGLVGVEVRFF